MTIGTDTESGAATVSGRSGDARHRTVLRYLLFNMVAAALAVAAAFQGWLGEIYGADPTRLTAAIAALFLFGLALCTRLLWAVDRALARALGGAPPTHPLVASYLRAASGADSAARMIRAENFRMRMLGRIGIVRYLANSLVVLGLIGTVIGFTIALSGVDPDIATDPSTVSPMVANLIEGLSVALYTTLVGAVLSLWLGLCHQMLLSAVRELVATTIDSGERAAGSPAAR